MSAPGTQREVTIVAHDIGSVGGMERQLAALIEGLAKAGDRVTVIARTCELGGEIEGVRFHRVRAPRRPFVLAYPWFLLAGSLALRRLRRGVVQATGAIVLGGVDVFAVHYLHQVGPVNPSRSSLAYRAQVRLAGLLKRGGERLCYRPQNATAFVAVSEGVAEELRTHLPAIAGSVVTIHNGVDTDAFAPAQDPGEVQALRASFGVPVEALVAAFVGSEWERKGLEPAIRALGAAPGWELAVAGDGDRERYQGLADAAGVGDRVHWLGVRSDVERVYRMADAFVLPSSYETFSLVSFEAAASGLAVLACPVSGVRELIEDGVNGYLITRQPETIAARLRALAEDPELRARLGAAARASALSYSWSRMVAEHRELYARIAARSGR